MLSKQREPECEQSGSSKSRPIKPEQQAYSEQQQQQVNSPHKFWPAGSDLNFDVTLLASRSYQDGPVGVACGLEIESYDLRASRVNGSLSLI